MTKIGKNFPKKNQWKIVAWSMKRWRVKNIRWDGESKSKNNTKDSGMNNSVIKKNWSIEYYILCLNKSVVSVHSAKDWNVLYPEIFN